MKLLIIWCSNVCRKVYDALFATFAHFSKKCLVAKQDEGSFESSSLKASQNKSQVACLCIYAMFLNVKGMKFKINLVFWICLVVAYGFMESLKVAYHECPCAFSVMSVMPQSQERIHRPLGLIQGRNEGCKEGTIPRASNHHGGVESLQGVPNHCGGAKKTQNCHKYYVQYCTFASERPQDRIWGRQTCFCPGRHLIPRYVPGLIKNLIMVDWIWRHQWAPFSELPRAPQGRDKVRWRPRQEETLAPLCSNLRSFESKCTVSKIVLVTLMDFPATRSHSAPPSDSAPGELCLLRFDPGPSQPSSDF